MADIIVARQTLLAIIENLARDEIESPGRQRRIPSTRELASIVAAVRNGRRTRIRKRA